MTKTSSNLSENLKKNSSDLMKLRSTPYSRNQNYNTEDAYFDKSSNLDFYGNIRKSGHSIKSDESENIVISVG